MSGNYDEYEQRYNDDPHPSDRDTGGNRPWRPDRVTIKSKLMLPGILLILLGVVPLGLGVIGGINWALGGLETQVEEQIRQFNEMVDANPNVPADERQQQKDLFAKVMRGYLQYMPVFLPVGLLGNLLVVAGGISMIRVGSRGLAMTGAILAMLPFMTCCCVAGLPIGIWSLILLNNADVKAAFQPPTQLGNDGW